ncbi:hypothetical protein [Scytonema sp. PRP1]
MSLKTKQYITLTPSAWQTLHEGAKEQGVSARELIECWARE